MHVFEWYERHGQVYPSGYFEQCKSCGQATCCVARRRFIFPGAVTPRLLTNKICHNEKAENMTDLSNNREGYKMQDTL